MEDVIRESDVRQVVRLGKTQYWDAVNAALHNGQQLAIAGEDEVGAQSPTQAFATWCRAMRGWLVIQEKTAQQAETARLDSPPPEEPPEEVVTE